MTDQLEPQFDAPIPGESLTTGEGGNNYKRPPQHNTIEEALAVYMETMQDEEFIDNLVAGLEMGVPVTTIANMIQLKGVIDGLHTIDVSMLILPILMEMIALVAESRDIEYDMGVEDKDRQSEELIISSVGRLSTQPMQAIEEEPVEIEEEVIDEEPAMGLMARSI